MIPGYPRGKSGNMRKMPSVVAAQMMSQRNKPTCQFCVKEIQPAQLVHVGSFYGATRGVAHTNCAWKSQVDFYTEDKITRSDIQEKLNNSAKGRLLPQYALSEIRKERRKTF